MNNIIEVMGVLFLLLFISLLSTPIIYWCLKSEITFSGYYNKKAFIFCLANALITTLLLSIVAIFLAAFIPDENAGDAIVWAVKTVSTYTLSYGFIFPYVIIYLVKLKSVV